MGTVVIILIVIAFVAVVVYNRRTSTMLMGGNQFEISASPAATRQALHAAYLQGAKATLRRMGSGVKLAPTSDGLRYQTKLGDSGEITVSPGAGGTSLVEVRATEMFVGHPSARRSQRGFWGLAVIMTHRLLTVAGYAPSASRLKRFHRGLEKQVSKQLARAVVG